MKTPKRVLLTTDTVGGVWTFALELARGLERNGIEVALATMGPRPSNSQRAEVSAQKKLTLYESEYALEWMPHPWDEVDRAGQWLLEIAEQFQPDLVHLNSYSHAALTWDVPVIVTAHSCIWSWWRAVKGSRPPLRYDQYWCRVRTGLSAAHLVVAPGREMAESLLQNYQLLINYAVIPNGRDRRPFFKGRKHPRIFSCGRIWDEAKNFLLLDRAAPAVQWPIEIAGDSQSEANTIGLRHLQSLGRLGVRQLADRFAQASIFVLPALYEPFGLSPLEAAWSGCALVLGDLASLREVWGAAAIFVSPHDPEELCAQLNRLTRDQRLREEMAARAFARAGAFSPEKMTASYLVAYQTCLTTKGMEVAA